MDMTRRLHDPDAQRFDASQLVLSYNRLLDNPTDHFSIGRPECAMEFLSCPGLRGGGILNNMEFTPGFLTSFQQDGFCPRCQRHELQVFLFNFLIYDFPFVLSHLYSSVIPINLAFLQPYPECILHIRIPAGRQPLDLSALTRTALSAPLHAFCNNHLCGTPLQHCRLQLALGRVFILNMARLGDDGVVSGT